MNPYPSYKPSGIELIGDIPSHWNVRRLKYEVNYQKGKTPKELSFEEKGEIYLSMEYLRGNPKQIFFVEDFEDFVNVNENEILLLWDGSNAGEFIRSKKGVLSSTMSVLKLNSVNTNFGWYFFKSIERILKEATIGMGIPHVNGEEFKNQIFIIPTKEEQNSIANYLGEKTTQIDNLITQKQKLVELLKEERTAIINEAVSGEGKNWERKKLKYLTEIISKGTTPSTVGEEILEDGNIRFLKAENILPANIISPYPENFISEKTNEILKRSELKIYDILIVIAGATIGKVCVLEKELIPANTNQAVCFIRLNDKKLANWIWYFLQSDSTKQNILIDAVQSAQPNLSMEKLGNFSITIPNENERNQAEKYIRYSTSNIDITISKIEREIELIQEYGIALISEVITGKIKVF